MTSLPNRGAVLWVALGALGLAYPFMVYLLLGRVPAGALVLVALVLVAGRLFGLRRASAARALMPSLALVLVATTAVGLFDAPMAALVYPVLMSLGMAAGFGLSLRQGPSLVECFASITEPDPSPAARTYMRRVSLVWCLFLAANAGVSALTAIRGDIALWTLYNGLISYVLMGVLFAGEYAVRRRMRLREVAR